MRQPSALTALQRRWEAPRSGGRRLQLSEEEYVCSDQRGHHSHTPLEPKLRGVNLGGWLVLQPWLTPSLFYQFEKKPPAQTAMDMYTFCRVLGPAEGNRQLRAHWEDWVTESDLTSLVSQGINTLRVPVGDWMWEPYGPYVGCTNGSLDELHRGLHLAERAGLRVLIVLHGVRRSQNGFDNSGHAVNVTWTSDDHFSHWPHRSAGWQGVFDPHTLAYSSISWDSIRATVRLLQRIAVHLRPHKGVLGVEALNEPWQFTPLDVLQAFYWDSYWAVRAAAPRWLFVVHDSFRLDEWGGFMAGCPAVAIDTHVYQAWFDIRSQQSFLDNACSWRGRVAAVQASTLPLLVGEWSLATDNCQMWLNGFHDNAPGYPKVECGSLPCPQPRVSGIAGPPQDADPSPHGTGSSAPSGGMCPCSKPWPNEGEMLPRLAEHSISAFEEAAGWFYWNFKLEHAPYWSWLAAHDHGWLPPNASNISSDVLATCGKHGALQPSAAGGAGHDLPWYNSLPGSRIGASPVPLMVGLGLGTLCGAAILLNTVLSIISRAALRQQNVKKGKLELPPRLLTYARKTQRRKPGGIGVLGLKQRLSQRHLTMLAYPLMNPHHAIEEAEEEAASSGGAHLFCNFYWLFLLPFALVFQPLPRAARLAAGVAVACGIVACKRASPKMYFWVTIPIYCVSLPTVVYTSHPALAALGCVALLLFKFGVCMSVVLHRYASHAAFKCAPATSLALGCLGCLANQGGPIWWASKHRSHHKHCETEKDPHCAALMGEIGAFAFFTNQQSVDEEFAPSHIDTLPMRIIDTYSLAFPLLEFALSYRYLGVGGLWASLTSAWLCQTFTLFFNLHNHPPPLAAPAGAAQPPKCIAVDGDEYHSGPGGVAWRPANPFLRGLRCLLPVSALLGEAAHRHHHDHPSLAKRPGPDWAYHAFVRPLAAAGVLWSVRV